MLRGIRIRLFPTKEQENNFLKHIGASRFMYNTMVQLHDEHYESGLGYLYLFDSIRLLPAIKKLYPWLNDISATTLMVICRDVDKAFINFFNSEKHNGRKVRHPKFKSKKHSKKAFPTRADQVYFRKGKVNIDKIGLVKCKSSKYFDLLSAESLGKKFKCYNPRISYINGKWLLGFVLEVENQDLVGTILEENMGIDVGIKELAVVTHGNKTYTIHNINKSKKIRALERKRRHIRRNISRKYRMNGSYENGKNISKEWDKIRKISARIHNIRMDHMHRATHQLIHDLKPKRVCVETLNTIGMMKNRHLSKAVHDQSLRTFIEMISYKCENIGAEFVKAPMFYPSSKTCSNCGNVKSDLELGDRTYVCEVCGLIIDRDVNASINLMKYPDSL